MKNIFDIENKVVALTGAAGILGSNFVQVLLEQGARVSFCDRDPERVNALKTKNAAFSDRLLAETLDIGDSPALRLWIQRSAERFGRLDTLVNNAQGKPDGFYESFENYSETTLLETFQVNLFAPIVAAQAAAPIFLKQGAGNVVNIGSIYGLVAPDQRIYDGIKSPYTDTPFSSPVSYATSKAAILQFTRYLASYYRGKNIRANSLTPGGVYDAHDARFVQNYEWRTLSGRMAARDDYDGALLFLVSDASLYMNGANLVVDGGWTAV